MMQIVELTGKNTKIVIIVTAFHMFKKIEGRLNMLETCMIQKKVQTELLKMKITMAEMKIHCIKLTDQTLQKKRSVNLKL